MDEDVNLIDAEPFALFKKRHNRTLRILDAFAANPDGFNLILEARVVN